MGGGDLNMKKSWHPLLMKNQERVWLEEKKAVCITYCWLSTTIRALCDIRVQSSALGGRAYHIGPVSDPSCSRLPCVLAVAYKKVYDARGPADEQPLPLALWYVVIPAIRTCDSVINAC